MHVTSPHVKKYPDNNSYAVLAFHLKLLYTLKGKPEKYLVLKSLNSFHTSMRQGFTPGNHYQGRREYDYPLQLRPRQLKLPFQIDLKP